MPEIWENPALNPTRRWADTDEIRVDLQLLVKGTPSERVALLRRLIDGPIREMKADEEAVAVFFNKVSAAFGFVDMIHIGDNYCSLTPGVREPLVKVLQKMS